MELWIAFLLATVSYAAVPGPGTAYVATQAVTRELRAAMWGALGLHVGGYAVVLAAAAGLTILFSAVPVLYQALKLLGAGYLVWLGIRLIGARTAPTEKDRGDRSQTKYPATFAQGVLVEILNPTTVLFYVAFLPQFIDASGGLPVWSQFLVLGVLVNLVFSLGDVVTVLVATGVKSGVQQSARGKRLLGWLGGGTLIALGLRLAADRS